MALLGLLAGVVVAVAGLNALYLCVSLVACAFILLDFRIGVVLLILLMPISSSAVFPHAMLGITGLNPLNLLLLATLGSGLLHGLADGSLRHFLPRPLLWLYILPIVAAGMIGAQHVGEIAPVFHVHALIDFDSTGGYLRDMLVKPLGMVLFAALVAAAVSRSAITEKFLVAGLISIWAIGLTVIVFVAQSGIGLKQLAGSDAREFLSALGLHANDLGRMYVVAYALLLFTWAGSRQAGEKFVLLVTMALVVCALVLTFSRGAFAGFVVVNAAFVLWRRSMRTLVAFGLAAAVALFAMPAAVYERAAVGSGEGWNAISAGRVDGLWLPLLPEIARSPIYGSGLGSIMWSAPMRASGGAGVLQATHPHSAYLQALLDMGVAGLVLLCAYFIHVWRGFRALSLDPHLAPAVRGYFQGAMAGLLSILVSSVTDGSLTPRPEQALLWLAIGMMYGQLHKRPAR
ncbi:MAG: O-antigen ligase family protein [Betaproteobacteria bacterium]